MAVTIADVMAECRNHFQRDHKYGAYEISSCVITPTDGITIGTYIAITGSLLNDGVYLVGAGYALTGTHDETFTGTVWYLRPPARFVALCTEIDTFDTANPPQTVTSESFGGYSRSMATNQNGVAAGWQTVYADSLRPYKRLIKTVPLC
jgi:hypothetical protein